MLGRGERSLRPAKDVSVKPFAFICLAILACIFGWHILLWSQAPNLPDVEVNPLTDVVYVYVPDVTAGTALDKDFVASFKGARDLVGGAIGDKELENKVRENFDVYGMVLPYHVIFKDKKAEARRTVAATPEPPPEPAPERPVVPRSGEYTNSRFGFSAVIPPGFEAGGSSENGDGVHFATPDGKATLSMYGSNSSGVTTKEYYDDLAHGLGVEPTYAKLADNWFVLSGQKGKNIFYTKVFVGSGSLNTFTFEYPAEQADQYRPLNDQIARSFKPGDLSQAW
jgi:hypothetical protein